MMTGAQQLSGLTVRLDLAQDERLLERRPSGGRRSVGDEEVDADPEGRGEVLEMLDGIYIHCRSV